MNSQNQDNLEVTIQEVVGINIPAEFHLHQRTFIEWPVKDSMVWPDNFEEVYRGYGETINAISEFEPITVLVNQNDYFTAKKYCNEKVDFLEIPHNDGWCRDNGPTFVHDKEKNLYGIDWKFNAWGEKYTPYDLDNEVAGNILKEFAIPKISAPLVLEGGSIHSDGEGTLLTTKECLLNKNRNPHLTVLEIEELVKKHLGVTQIIWLNQGLDGDETDGHVDNIACFGAPGKVIIQVCDDESDPNYMITKENLDILEHTLDAKGRKLEIIKIPQPPIQFYKNSRLTLSYLNFYFVNGGIVLPIFGGDAKETDKNAIRILQEHFPDRKIVTVDGMAIVKEGGNVHCITQQMPR